MLAQFPNGQSLQPLPQNVRADTSESVQRNATPADIQNAENAPQPVQAPAPTVGVQQPQGFDVTQAASSLGSFAPWLLLAFAIVIVAGGAWLWRAFVE